MCRAGLSAASRRARGRSDAPDNRYRPHAPDRLIGARPLADDGGACPWSSGRCRTSSLAWRPPAFPSGAAMAQQAASSIGEAVSLSQALPAGVAQALMAAAKTAFIQAHSLVLATAGVLLLLLAAGIWRSLATVAKPQSAL